MWKKKLYIKNNLSSYNLNRTKVELFIDCRKCFYLNIVKGVRRPHGPPLVINNAIISLMKNEFDSYRKKNTTHNAMDLINHKLRVVDHENLEIWRNNFKGVRYLHKPTNLELSGSINDLWFDSNENKFVVVDYKSTSKKEELTEEILWPGYWKQLSFYKYLLEKNGLKVSENGYLFLTNAKKYEKKFDNQLLFDSKIFSKKLDTEWIEPLILEIFDVLQSDLSPPSSRNCRYCQYVNIVNSAY